MSDDDDEVREYLFNKNRIYKRNIQPHVIQDQPYDESMDVRNR